jgi:hypothetical protein
MPYRVHRLDLDLTSDLGRLEQFLNGLTGEVVAVLPNVRTPSLAWIYGLRRSVDFVAVVERLADKS